MSFEKIVSQSALIINLLQVQLRIIERFCRFSCQNIPPHIGTHGGVRKEVRVHETLYMLCNVTQRCNRETTKDPPDFPDEKF